MSDESDDDPSKTRNSEKRKRNFNKREKKAVCWKFFSFENNLDGDPGNGRYGNVVCKCGTKFAYSGSTSTLNNHIRKCTEYYFLKYHFKTISFPKQFQIFKGQLIFI